MRPIKVIFDELQKEKAEAQPFIQRHYKAASNSFDFEKGSAEYTEYKQREERVAALKDEHAEALKAARFAENSMQDFGGEDERPLPAGGSAGEFKSLGERYTESEAFQSRFNNGGFDQGNYKGALKEKDVQIAVARAGMKTSYTLTSDATNAGFPSESRRTGIVVPIARNKLFLQDLVVNQPWNMPSVPWMKQTLADDQSAIVGEEATKPQNTYKWEEVTVPLKTIAAWVKVTKQQLKRQETIRTLIDVELTKDIRKRVQKKCLTGTGTPSDSTDICGIANDPNIQTLSGSGYSLQNMFDLIFTAMSMVEGETEGVGGGDADIVVLAQKDYRRIKLTKDAIGNYMYGSPADPIQDRVWGVHLLGTKDLAEGNGLVGDTSVIRHFTGEDLNITTGWVNTDYIQNQLVILAEIEMAQIITKGDCWVRLTNLPSA